MSLLNELCEAMGSKPPEEVRNVCLIAHVDHGKTSLADSLCSANAIVSNRLAGKVRFLDSREDEQTRGITMKASGVSLLYGPLLVNLMDSPGHVDFSSEVTSAICLSDIALLLVDVVEGVCSQTSALLRQAIVNGQSLILVINKLDRLRLELKLTASETYTHVRRLIEAVNACVSQIVSGIILDDETWGNIEDLEEKLHFDPCKGNVLFSSAIHGYAFSLEEFAEIYLEKLKMDKRTIMNGLFGDFYFTPQGIKSGANAKGKKTLFEQLIMEPIWALHDCGLIDNDLEKLTKLAEKIEVPFKSKRVNEAFDEVMRNWLPISRACFRACARTVSAKKAFTNQQRLKKLLGDPTSHPLAEAIENCSPEGMTIAFVVKFIRLEGQRVAICRVLSGKVRKGDKLFVLGAKKLEDSSDAVETEVISVKMLRGRECIPLAEVNSGCICVIEANGLLQNSTLCSEAVSQGIQLGREQGEPLVRVSINTLDLNATEDFKEALKLLSVLDTSLRVLELETGELALVTAGEVHLQKCLKDLADLGFPDLEVSAPIVPFLETIVPDPLLTSAQIVAQDTECRLRGDALFIRLRAAPLHIDVVDFMDKHADIVHQLRLGKADVKLAEDFKSKLQNLCKEVLPSMKGTYWFKKSNEEIEELVEKIWTVGTDRARANLLINGIPSYDRKSFWNKEEGRIRPFDQAMISGFELFIGAGPLCNEAMRGIALIVEDWILDENDAVVTGQLMSAMKATCKASCEKVGLRLVAAMYRCLVSTTSQALGKVHGVLAQRKAKVLSEDINEATGLFEVAALLPIVESFSFCDQLRTQSSGMASAQLQFSHWEVIDEDPYWQPSTLEEMEEFGLKGDSPNHARGYMDAVRRRKGLPTEDVIVVSAEKQRNLKKNK
ncbi:unnamed protein product [Auanema sp. JU1783]|nr:unnamed protein product [Auanema sp. JU1783]